MRTVSMIGWGLWMTLAVAEADHTLRPGDFDPSESISLRPPNDSLPKVDQRTLETCLAKVEPFKDSCLSVLGTCVARTAQGGTQTLEPPIVASAGTPCSARVALHRQACAQGLSPDDFLEGDIACGAAQF